MRTDKTRILVIGAGLNGSICAAGLHNAGINTTILARGQRLVDIMSEGIIIEDPLKGTRTVTAVPAIDTLSPADEYDYILVVVRRHQLPELLPLLAMNKSPSIVFMCNNPRGSEDLAEALGKERIMLGWVFGAGKRDGKIIRGITNTRGSLSALMANSPFGETDGRITPRLRRLVRILRSAGFNAKVSSRMREFLATHSILPVLIPPIAYRYGLDRSRMIDAKEDLELLIDAIRESLAILPDVGLRITPIGMKVIMMLPRFILIAGLKSLIASRMGEISFWWDMSAESAPAEIAELIAEFKALIKNSKLQKSSIEKILAYPLEPA